MCSSWDLGIEDKNLLWSWQIRINERAGMPAAALEIVMVLYLLQWKVIESEVPIPDELLEYGPNLSGHSSWLDTYFWSGKLYGKACCWEWTPKRNVVQWDWTLCSNYEHHFRVNGGHNRVSLICDHSIKGKYLLIAKFGVGSTKGCNLRDAYYFRAFFCRMNGRYARMG